jgi:hypothetical protein
MRLFSRAKLGVAIAAIAGCAQNAPAPAPLGLDRVPIRDLRAPQPVAIFHSPGPLELQYGTITSPIELDRMVDTSCEEQPPLCGRKNGPTPKQMGPMDHVTGLAGTAAFMFGAIWIPIVVAGGMVYAVAVVPFTENTKQPAGDQFSESKKYAEWLGQLFLVHPESRDPFDRLYIASLLAELGWTPQTEPELQPTKRVRHISVGVTRVGLFRMDGNQSLLLLCGESWFYAEEGWGTIEVCQTTSLDSGQLPRLGDDDALKKLVADGVERLGRLQAKALTTPIPRGSRLKVAVPSSPNRPPSEEGPDRQSSDDIEGYGKSCNSNVDCAGTLRCINSSCVR